MRPTSSVVSVAVAIHVRVRPMASPSSLAFGCSVADATGARALFQRSPVRRSQGKTRVCPQPLSWVLWHRNRQGGGRDPGTCSAPRFRSCCGSGNLFAKHGLLLASRRTLLSRSVGVARQTASLNRDGTVSQLFDSLRFDGALRPAGIRSKRVDAHCVLADELARRSTRNLRRARPGSRARIRRSAPRRAIDRETGSDRPATRDNGTAERARSSSRAASIQDARHFARRTHAVALAQPSRVHSGASRANLAAVRPRAGEAAQRARRQPSAG
jgi:hypothetical protein